MKFLRLEEPINETMLGEIDAYLVELRSLGGLSGSPVFIYPSGVRRSDTGASLLISGKPMIFLLGVLYGHWSLSNAIQDVVTEDYPDNERDKINTGIGIVTPATTILETLSSNT